MRFFHGHFKSLFLCLLLLSCGIENRGLRTKRAYSPLGFNEVQCYGFRGEISDEVIEINKIGERVQNFRKKFPLITGGYTSISKETLLGTFLKNPKTYYSPLLTSEIILKDYLDSLKTITEDYFSESDSLKIKTLLFEGKDTISINDFDESASVGETLILVDYLIEQAQRWKTMQCALNYLTEQGSKDVRDLLRIKKAFSSKEEMNRLVTNFSTLEPMEKNRLLSIKDDVIKVCKDLNLSQMACDSNWHSFIPQIIEYYETFSDETFFKIGKEGGNFKCENKDGYKVLYIPIQYANSKEKLKLDTLLEKSILKMWSHPESKLKIEFEERKDLSKDQTFRIVDKKSAVSHVDLNQPLEIVMQENLGLNEYEKTLSHEFGHVLGFKDCYLEFYDDHNHEMVYYELDKTNLMCSKDYRSTISLEQLNMVENKYCP